MGVGGVLLTLGALGSVPALSFFPHLLFPLALYLGLALVFSGILLAIYSWRPDFSAFEARYEFERVKRQELKQLMRFVARFLDDLPSYRTVKDIHKVNPNCLFLARRIRESPWWTTSSKVGFFSILPLHPEAVELLDREALDGLRFTSQHIATPKQRTNAIYIGSVAARGFRAKAEILGYLKGKVDDLVDTGVKFVYTRPVTQDGLRLVRRHGFVPVDDNIDYELGRVYKKEW